MQRFYENNSFGDFDSLAINAFKNYSASKEKIKSTNNEICINLANDIMHASEKYVDTIAKYNPKKLAKMDSIERQMEIADLSATRRSAHNSLISKLNPAKRYFKKNGFGNIFNIPETNEIDRNPAAIYASRLVMGKYLTENNR